MDTKKSLLRLLVQRLVREVAHFALVILLPRMLSKIQFDEIFQFALHEMNLVKIKFGKV